MPVLPPFVLPGETLPIAGLPVKSSGPEDAPAMEGAFDMSDEPVIVPAAGGNVAFAPCDNPSEDRKMYESKS